MFDKQLKFEFHVVDEAHEPLILQWLHKPHVNEFFHGEGLRNTIDGLRRFIAKQDPRWDAWIAYHDGNPFGFLMTSPVLESEANDPKNPLARWIEPGKKMMTLDLLIGEEDYLGKGYACPMINQFLSDHFSDVDIIFIDPECSNSKAIHVYEKAGFKKNDQFVACWHPVPHWLMSRRCFN